MASAIGVLVTVQAARTHTGGRSSGARTPESERLHREWPEGRR